MSPVLTGRKPRIASPLPIVKPQSGEADVEGAEPERVAAGGEAGDEQAERAGEDVEDVVPAVDAKSAEALSTSPGEPKEAL